MDKPRKSKERITKEKEACEAFLKASTYYNKALFYLTEKYTAYPPINMVGWLKKEFYDLEKFYNHIKLP